MLAMLWSSIAMMAMRSLGSRLLAELAKDQAPIQGSITTVEDEGDKRRESIVAALKTIGIKVEVSCEEGVCGTCVCTVLEGECDHRDVYLTDEEKADNDQIMTCCSRAKSARLVLDI